MNATTLFKGKNSPVATSIVTGISTLLFLFFIDEGRFDFSWMSHVGAWFAFCFYLAGILLSQCLVYLVILKNYKGDYKNTLTSVIGVPVGIALVVCAFLLML
jgi:hypothetical protein